jgi:hypothetical protein
VCNLSAQDNGWCYIDNITTTTGCAQEILFSKSALQPGVTTSLQCLESSSGIDGGAVTTTAPVSTTPPANTDAGAAGH